MNRRFLFTLLLILAGSICTAVYATQFPRHQVVALYLFRLAEHVQWPNESQIDQYHIHLVDDSSLIADQLNKVARLKTLHGKPFKVSWGGSASIPQDAHIVFVTNEHASSYKTIFQATNEQPILLVSDRLLDQRSVLINLEDDADNKLKFEINKANILNRGLGVRPDIILLGGTEIDVAQLYRKSQALLETTEQKLLDLESERHKLEQALTQARKESDVLENKIHSQQSLFIAQQVLLEEKESRIQVEHMRLQQAIEKSLKQEELIKSQQATIELRKEQFNKLAVDVEQKTAALLKQEAAITEHEGALEEQKKEILARQDILAAQDKKIKEQGEVLLEQDRTISSQAYVLYLMAFVVILLVALSVVMYRSYRHKQRSNAELASTAKELEIMKEKADSANHAKSVFLANMSHELRTPLNTILGFSELMAEDPDIDPDQAHDLQLIRNAGNHLLSIINDVLDLSKIEAGRIELEPHSDNLHALIKEVDAIVRGRAESSGLIFNVDIASDVPTEVMVDGAKFRQILINLIGNSIKFTEEGSVTLRLHAQLDDAKSETTLFAEIEDTGPGISADMLDNVFKPFVQTGARESKNKGTGLGLSISREFIKLMNGHISVESELGKGTIFKFDISLPVLSKDVKAVAMTPRRIIGLAANERKPRILIVEDIENNRLLLRQILDKAGFEVIEAEDGKEAIERFKEDNPELIWMDMNMPVMNGYETVPEIRALPGGDDVIIIALTASALQEQRDSMIAAGCDDLVSKPYLREDILNTMQEYLGLEYEYDETKKRL